MILVLPVSHVDLGRAEKLANRIARYGGMEEETIFLCSTWNAGWDIDPLFYNLGRSFGIVRYHRLGTECEMGWPEAANHLFYETSKQVRELDISEPWYFMEADCTPLRPGWFEALKQEYAAAGKPYMGAVNKSRWRGPNGEQEIRGKHMVGTGIYPPDFLERCELIHRVDVIPWDVAIGPEIIHEVHDTKLISHHWGCKNAQRKNDGLIYCESIDPTKEYNAGVIPTEAVVAHGVKDGSLDFVLDQSEPSGIPAS